MSGGGCGFKDEQLPAGDFIMVPILIAGPPPVSGTPTVTSPHPQLHPHLSFYPSGKAKVLPHAGNHILPAGNGLLHVNVSN